MIRRWDHLFQPFHRLALRLEQPPKVMVHGGFYRSCPPTEMAPEPLPKAKEPLTNPCQLSHHRVGSRLFLTLSGAVPLIFNLVVPCLLIKRVLSLLIYQHQSDTSDKVEIATGALPGCYLLTPISVNGFPFFQESA